MAVGGYSLLIVFLMTLGLPVIALMPLGLVKGGSLSWPENWIQWALFACACGIGFYSSVALARFVLRLVPIRADGKRRVGFIVAGGCLGAALSASWLAAARVDREVLASSVLLGIVVLGAMLLTLIWHSRTTHLLDGPLILFLRRFSSFSDRSVLGAILSACPAGVRAAFLVPRRESPANFSPIVFAFGGARFFRPLASCPIPLEARDVEWEDRLEDLIRAAACVVIDSSELTPAIVKEVEIVRRITSAERVLWLVDEVAAKKDANQVAPDELLGGRKIVGYCRSWRAAAPANAVRGARNRHGRGHVLGRRLEGPWASGVGGVVHLSGTRGAWAAHHHSAVCEPEGQSRHPLRRARSSTQEGLQSPVRWPERHRPNGSVACSVRKRASVAGSATLWERPRGK